MAELKKETWWNLGNNWLHLSNNYRWARHCFPRQNKPLLDLHLLTEQGAGVHDFYIEDDKVYIVGGASMNISRIWQSTIGEIDKKENYYYVHTAYCLSIDGFSYTSI